MSITLFLGYYVLFWWVSFLALLPVGVRTQGEAGRVAPGTPESAPTHPGVLKKALWASLIALVLTSATALILPRIF